jgi:ornithine decarboxylase
MRRDHHRLAGQGRLTDASVGGRADGRRIRSPAVPSLTESPAGPVSSVSPAVERFLAETDLPTPFVVVDLAHVESRYADLQAALPGVELCYAVKANPAAAVIERLARRGSSFDVASPGEIDLVLGLGVDPALVSYGNTLKKRRDVAFAAACGVRRFAVDCDAELDKVLGEAPGSEVCVRLYHDCHGADWPLSRKFGCGSADAARLVARASAAGSRVGLSFHVGSQQRHLDAWDEPLRVCVAVAESAGVMLDFVNLGGGFPGTYLDEVAPIGAYGTAILCAVDTAFGGNRPALVAEPGRYLVADAGVLRSEVVLVSERDVDDRRWVYLDVGLFGGLAETAGEAIRYRLRTPGHADPGEVGEVVLAGPTCDSADVIYDKAGYAMPLALRAGDMVDVLSAGAYTTSYSAVGFNGFPPLAQHHVN